MKDLEFKNYIQANYLATIGQKLHLRRKSLKVSAESVAIAAGISRITLHRIEKGEPGVSMGAFVSVIEALGLQFIVSSKDLDKTDVSMPEINLNKISIKEYPQLKQLAWQLHDDAELTAVEAKNMYERNEKHIYFDLISEKERELIKLLGVEFKSKRGN
jgi:transcriptional regulator with XRE-family HTH domain